MEKVSSIAELSRRSQEIFQRVVETYMETGDPVGSRTVSEQMQSALSSASIRNAMADLEGAGLLYAPHTSAGRMPTESGLRLFVNGLMEVGRLSEEDRRVIEAECGRTNRGMEESLREASRMLSGLSDCAGMVWAPKTDRALKHVEFVHLGPGRALVVLVTEDGVVENRLISLPPGVLPASLTEASNYLSSRLAGRTFEEARDEIAREIEKHQAALDEITSRVVEEGLASWTGAAADNGTLIVHGQSRLLSDIQAVSDLERLRGLMQALETKEDVIRFLDLAQEAEGVQIFIGSENTLFDMSGCSMITAPYRNGQEQIVGAIGVIGPTRMNYARIIPLVDYTARMLGQRIG